MFDGSDQTLSGPHLVETRPLTRKPKTSAWLLLLLGSLGLHALVYFGVKIEGTLHAVQNTDWTDTDFQVELVRPTPRPVPVPVPVIAAIPAQAGAGNAPKSALTPGLTGVRTAKSPSPATAPSLPAAGSSTPGTGRTAGGQGQTRAGIGWSDGNDEGDKVRKALRGSVACMHQDDIKLSDKERANCEQRLSTLGKDAPDLGPAGAIKNNDRYQQARSAYNKRMTDMEALSPSPTANTGILTGGVLLQNRDTRPPKTSETDERANTQVAPWLKPKPKPAEPFVGKEPPRTKPLE